ncbi:HhH-GPD-type base excision DNA repair protein [Amnibacterium kyonggiense]
MTTALHITGDDAADALLSSDPFALLVGMLLDQQVPMETAFAGPAKIRERLGRIDPAALAAEDPEHLTAVFRQPPAVHRYPGSMAGRVRALAGAVQEEWGGDASAIWTRDDPDGAEVLRRLEALPGYGAQKARILLALLGKRDRFDGPGWREAAGAYGEDGHRSVADVVDAQSLAAVRAFKQAAKAAAKG